MKNLLKKQTLLLFFFFKGSLPKWCSGKESICQCRGCRCGFDPWCSPRGCRVRHNWAHTNTLSELESGQSFITPFPRLDTLPVQLSKEAEMPVKTGIKNSQSLAKQEKAMATHSSVLAWGIPGTAEPGGLPLWDLTE